MGRKALRDTSAVLDDALKVFWRSGFSDASARDLLQQSGVHPGSLYHRFGSKEGLFLAVVDHYIESVVKARIAEYLQTDDAVRGMRRFFQTAFDGPSPGCLLANTAAEFGCMNDQVQARVALGYNTQIDGFSAQIERDVRLSGVTRSARRRLAQSLFVAFQGYVVVGKSEPSLQKRAQYITAILETTLQPYL